MTSNTTTADAKIEEFIKKQKMLLSIIRADRATFDDITFGQDCDGYCGWDDDDNIDLIMSKHSLSEDDAVGIARIMRAARIDILAFAHRGADAAANRAAGFVSEDPMWEDARGEYATVLDTQYIHACAYNATYDAILSEERKHMTEHIERIMFKHVRAYMHE